MAAVRRQQHLATPTPGWGVLLCCLGVGLLVWLGWRVSPAFSPADAEAVAELPEVEHYEALSGDVVLVRGKGWRSKAVLIGSRGGLWSHAGIVFVDEAGAPWVIHAVPAHGESPGWILRQSFEQFFEDPNIEMVGVYRVPEAQRELASAAGAQAQWYFDEGVGFDDAFDASDPSSLYCTELISASYAEAGVDLIEGQALPSTWPVFDYPVQFPQALSQSPHLVAVGRLPMPDTDDEEAVQGLEEALLDVDASGTLEMVPVTEHTTLLGGSVQ